MKFRFSPDVEARLARLSERQIGMVESRLLAAIQDVEVIAAAVAAQRRPSRTPVGSPHLRRVK